MSAHDRLGILPDEVVRDPDAEAALVFVHLVEPLAEPEAAAFLTGLAALRRQLQAPDRHRRVRASLTLALGGAFFARYPERAAATPAGLAHPPALPVANPLAADALVYATVTAEDKVSELLVALEADPRVDRLEVQRGARTGSDRETFGQRDGLRNVVPAAHRHRAVFIDAERQPEEPAWTRGGSYAAYLKIAQNTQGWAGLDPTAREQVIGRRADGSRTDQPPGANPRTEPDYTDPALPPLTSHVRRVGPRGPHHDGIAILRRGIPYTEPTADGPLGRGLHFLSYQAELAAFDTVLNEWMLNPDFPTPGTGQDALLATGLISFLAGGYFFVPPPDERFPAAGFFDPPPAQHSRTGRIVLAKTVLDAAGARARAERAGLIVTLINPETGAPIGEPLTLNAAGRAVSDPLPVGTAVLLRENDDPRFAHHDDVAITVAPGALVVELVNHLVGPGYPG